MVAVSFQNGKTSYTCLGPYWYWCAVQEALVRGIYAIADRCPPKRQMG